MDKAPLSASIAAQRQRVLARLERGPATTLELRADEDILHPPGRIKELRDSGHNIALLWVQRQTEGGAVHRVGLYQLRSAPGA